MPRYFEGYDENDSSTTSVLLTFILGAAAGVAAGMLLSPKSGQENRQKIANTANDLANKASSQWGNLKNTATSTINKVTDQVKGATGKSTNPTDQLNNV